MESLLGNTNPHLFIFQNDSFLRPESGIIIDRVRYSNLSDLDNIKDSRIHIMDFAGTISGLSGNRFIIIHLLDDSGVYAFQLATSFGADGPLFKRQRYGKAEWSSWFKTK